MRVEEQSMTVLRNYGFLTKLKNFLKTLVYDNKLNEYSANISQKEDDEITKAFGKRIKETEGEELESLKEQLIKGEISTKSIPEDKKQSLISIMKKQIENKKNQLGNIKRRIEYLDKMIEKKA